MNPSEIFAVIHVTLSKSHLPVQSIRSHCQHLPHLLPTPFPLLPDSPQPINPLPRSPRPNRPPSGQLPEPSPKTGSLHTQRASFPAPIGFCSRLSLQPDSITDQSRPSINRQAYPQRSSGILKSLVTLFALNDAPIIGAMLPIGSHQFPARASPTNASPRHLSISPTTSPTSPLPCLLCLSQPLRSKLP